jgi:hypothetical protein
VLDLGVDVKAQATTPLLRIDLACSPEEAVALVIGRIKELKRF